MTTATIKICDACRAEGRSDTEIEKYNSFQDIKIELELYAPYSTRRPSKYYTLCEQCLAKIGVFLNTTSEQILHSQNLIDEPESQNKKKEENNGRA